MKHLLHTCAIGPMSAVALLAAPVSQAASVTYEYTATIVAIDFVSGNSMDTLDILNSYGIELGASASGGYTVDADATDFSNDPNIGFYLTAVQSIAYQFGDLLIDTDVNASGSTQFDVIDGGSGGSGSDRWSASSSIDFDAPEFLTSPFALLLTSASGGVLNGDRLDQALPPLSAFDPFNPASGITTEALAVLRLTNGDIVQVRAELNSHTLVPIPGAVWLMGSAIVGLGGLLRRRTGAASA